MTNRVAAALEQTFKDRVAETASTPEKAITFEETGVVAPGFDVWERYARTAIEAMREPTWLMHIALRHAMEKGVPGGKVPTELRSHSVQVLEDETMAFIGWRAMIDEVLE